MAIMGVVLLAVMSLSSFFVCGGVLPIDGLPVPECVDTEVSTNIPIRVDLDRMDKMRFVIIREMIIRGCCLLMRRLCPDRLLSYFSA